MAIQFITTCYVKAETTQGTKRNYYYDTDSDVFEVTFKIVDEKEVAEPISKIRFIKDWMNNEST